MKKKLISILLCIVAVATMTGCGKRIDEEALREEIRDELEEEIRDELEEEIRAELEDEIRAELEDEIRAELEDEMEDEEEVNEEEEEQAADPTPSKEPVAGSTDWSSLTFALDGKTYSIPFAYEDIKSEWSFDMADYGYENGYVMNPGEYVYSTIDLEHDTYDCTFYIGLKNYSDSVLDITECDVWAASVDITWADSYPSLELPGGLTWGSSLEEVEALYGVPEDTYRSEELGYWSYEYNIDNDYLFSLVIYDDKGITEFGYKLYD